MLPETGQTIPLLVVAILIGVGLLLRLGTSRARRDDEEGRPRR